MAAPTEPLLIWAASDVNLPNLAGPNKKKPIKDLISKGWDFKQKPAASEFNYILNNICQHISYLEEGFTYNFTGDVTGSVVSSGSENFSVNLQVVDNSHNHISANISDATSANNSNTVVKRGASGEISVGDLTISKVGGVSTISFPATESDTGYIKHSETNDVSRMQFSISDNNDSIDKFEFGNTEGGSFVPRFTIDANGTTNVKSSVTATNFIGPLQGNALTATTLQTARTINGTSFNGSANITTNSWGAARTFALTGAVTGSVSVDGSDDVNFNISVNDNSHNHISANISDATSQNTPNMVVRRDINGDVAARVFVGSLYGTASYASTATNNVSVLTGTISHGGTIPLPSGYSEGQCRWMVSMNNDNPSNTAWDIDEDGASVHYKQQVYTTGRVVTAQTYLGSNNSPPGWISSTANYIIIGVK